MGLDAGPKSIALFREAILPGQDHRLERPLRRVRVREVCAASTKAMAEAIAEATAHGATTVVGGGDTATAAKKFKVADKVTHCSTGGGASLEYLEGKVLPGVAFPGNLRGPPPMTRKKLIAGNWKMNKTAADAVALAQGHRRRGGQAETTSTSSSARRSPRSRRRQGDRRLPGEARGAEHAPEDSGAFTGEVSAPMLRALFVTHVILGHSERRTALRRDRRAS
jgi:triosephosphate isomerase (TIM)